MIKQFYRMNIDNGFSLIADAPYIIDVLSEELPYSKEEKFVSIPKKVIIESVEMTQEEVDALPEWSGP